MLRTHCQTSGWSLTQQDPYNNIIRTTLEALSAVLGGTQSLHTNSFDEAVGLPTDFSARIARNTQIILQQETSICNTVDPLGGSYYIESLTNSIVQEARKIISEVDEMGGMAKAIAAGMPKMRIEESSARKQARIDQGKDVIVGVNKYQVEEDRELDVLEVSSTVREEQVARLKEIRASRDDAEVKRALEAVTNCAAADGNLLEVCIPAMRARATVGEVSDAIEKVFGRYVATTQCISGAFAAEYGESEVIESVRKRTAEFAEKHGRRPRILVTKMGQDGHDRGYKLISSAYADLGFDVDISPMFQTPAEAARMAIENDVHVVGVSSLAAGHKYLVPEVRRELDEQGSKEIYVVVGGIIPPKDYDLLLASGAAAIFGPGTPVIESANKVLNILEAL
jgi:methylmalonyl-CoA mutase